MSDRDDDITRDDGMQPPEVEQEHPAKEPSEAPGELPCPVCDRLIPPPAPEFCPHCNAPIDIILDLMRVADQSIAEAMRDIRIGDLDSVEQRLELVRATSKKHRLKVEAVLAVVDRLRGDPASALARIRAVEEKMDEFDELIVELIEDVEKQAMIDQGALALCCEHYNFGLFQAKRGHLEEARATLKKSLEAVPWHPDSHALMGKVLVALREEDEAKYHLRRALAADPTNVSASRMMTKLGRGKMGTAIEKVAAFLRTNPAWAGSALVILILVVIAFVAWVSG